MVLVLVHLLMLWAVVAIGARFLEVRDCRRLELLLAITLIGALAIGRAVQFAGVVAALTVLVVSWVWMLVAYQDRMA